MAKFAAKLSRTLSTTLSIGTLCADATTPRRQKLYELNFGTTGTPGDNAIQLQVQRCTTQGTATATTPQPIDPADAAALADTQENHTVDPTLTANAFLLSLGLNHRSTFRWVAVQGGELLIPATANNGVAVRTPVAPAVAADITLQFEEQ